ncbi:MAG: hypothetical protein ACTSQ4_10785 [Candidatus Heimdallarchaeaceae archaeon]
MNEYFGILTAYKINLERIRRNHIKVYQLYVQIVSEGKIQLKAGSGIGVAHHIAGSYMILSETNKKLIENLAITAKLANYLEIPMKIDHLTSQFSRPETYNQGEEGINKIFENLKSYFEKFNKVINKRKKIFCDIERSRINEALFTFSSKCYLSAIINCAVVLESRLLKILKEKNEVFLRSINSRMQFTLGQLINTYLENKDKFQNTIPVKYDNLLKACNSYRILSAHAKNEELSINDAQAVLSMTFSFMLDERLSKSFG